ncbi:Mlc titration factor A [Bordetella ansorpii]|uniref:Mlc titration factor A n=1 Tax=Bordetella ansorpii TaxID=288768 RepID=A0A157STA7_9BORD|nr:M90 family metallopeptidase [Bordetella ansorpii]SAI73657.1 Mlc titration factor A [Bordetella ansorpii]
MFRWLRGRGAAAPDVAEMQARIPDDLWQRVLSAYPFLAPLAAPEREQLRARCAWLLASKNLNGARGLDPTDFMRLAIAAQAALPILHLSPSLYEGWDEIILYPEGFSIPRRQMDEDGVVHEYVEEAAGEAWDGGPVVLSWSDPDPEAGAFNAVIHEFAHKLDLHAGQADGMPSLAAHPDIKPRVWRQVLADSYDRYVAALEAVEAAIAPDVDPESEDADAWYASLPLDPYAATDEAEFFAVSSEHFFIDPLPLAQALPDWHALLRAYYRQDTLARLA